MRRYFLSAVLAVLSLSCLADPVSRTEALSSAKAFLANRGVAMINTESPYQAPRRKIAGQTTENAAYYIFNVGNDNGYVIVSGDDRTDEILGYVEQGSFDENQLPDGLQFLLQFYRDQIQQLDDYDVQVDRKAIKARRLVSQTHHSVAPLMKSRWDQFSPYNLYCPMYYDSDGSTGEHSATGCVATALAQVLYYYKYPAATTAAIPQLTNSYTLDNGAKKTVTCKAIASNSKIDWDNMSDVYNSLSTDEQKQAVAKLMLYVGQSVGMGYGSSSAAGFGTNVTDAMQKYFGYDDQVYMADRSKYSIDGWFNLVYDEIAAGHPVAYAGSSSSGAHAFVLDGFDGESLFHVDWGWGGGSNGYFLIDVLNPGDDSGIGATTGSDGYAAVLGALMGMRMPDDEEVEPSTAMSINDITVSGATVKANYINWTGVTNSFNYGIVRQLEDGSYKVIGSYKTAQSMSKNTYYTETFNLRGSLPRGTYKISPASKVAGKKIWRTALNMQTDYILAEVTTIKTTLTYVTPKQNIVVAEWNFVGNHVAGNKQEVKVTFQNQGDDYYDEVHIWASKTSNMGSSNCRVPVALHEDESRTYSLYFTPQETGTYNIWLSQDGDGKEIVGSTTVDIISSTQAKKASLKFNSYSISNASGLTVYGNQMTGKVGIKNEGSTDYHGNVKLQLWIKNANDNICYGSSSTNVWMDIEAGKSANASIDFQGLEVNRGYFLTAYYTTQSGELSNGGLVWDHYFTINPGILYWNSVGTLAAVAGKYSYLSATTTTGIYINSSEVKRVTANRNPNTIYAFSDDCDVPVSLKGKNTVQNGVADTINLTDGYGMYCPVSFTANHATFSHTFTLTGDGEKGWETFTLPFQATSATIDGQPVTWVGDDAAVSLREFTQLGDSSEVIFQEVETLRANTPYVIAAPASLAGKTIVFSGDNVEFAQSGTDKMIVSSSAFNHYGTTYMTSVSKCYVLNAEGSAFEWADTKQSLEPLATYITTTLSEAKRPASIPIGTYTTAIRDIQAETPSTPQQQGALYNLMGQKVSHAAKGIYIQNRKKKLYK